MRVQFEPGICRAPATNLKLVAIRRVTAIRSAQPTRISSWPPRGQVDASAAAACVGYALIPDGSLASGVEAQPSPRIQRAEFLHVGAGLLLRKLVPGLHPMQRQVSSKTSPADSAAPAECKMAEAASAAADVRRSIGQSAGRS